MITHVKHWENSTAKRATQVQERRKKDIKMLLHTQ
jgi:hypothetical protein